MFDEPFTPPELPPPPGVGGGPGTTELPPTPNPQAGYADSIAQWIRQYFGRDPHPGEVQSWLDPQAPPIEQVETLMRNSQEAQQYAARTAATQGGTAPPGGNTTSPPTPPPGPGPNVGGLIQPFGQTFAPPPASPYPDAPTFHQPTMEEAANDPGYRFTLDQGKRNLDSWLSAHGTFNDSSAAEALQNYGQGAAATQYGNVWNRQFQAYQGALGPWQTTVARTQHDNDVGWQNAFNSWLQNWNIYKDQRDSTFDKQYKVATA